MVSSRPTAVEGFFLHKMKKIRQDFKALPIERIDTRGKSIGCCFDTKQELQNLYDEAQKIYNNYLWNGHNTDSELARLSELRSQYILKSDGRTMPDLKYKHFQ